MRKSSIKFQSKRAGGRAALSSKFSTSTGEALPQHRRDVCALTHQIVNDKSVQIAQSYGLMNLLRRVSGYWLPRNTHKAVAGDSFQSGVRVVQGMLVDGKPNQFSTKVHRQYYRDGVHA